MEIVYYRTRSGYVPVKQFLHSRYNFADKADLKKFAKVEAIIHLAADRNGIPGGNFSSSLVGYDFQELRVTEGKQLIRILYFAFDGRQLVLLNAFDKPKLYEKLGKKKVNLKIDSINEETQNYYKDFLQNPTHCQKYE